MEAQACRAPGRPELDHRCLGLPGCPCALPGAQHMVGVRGSWVPERETGERGVGEGREEGGRGRVAALPWASRCPCLSGQALCHCLLFSQEPVACGPSPVLIL